MDLNKVMLIGRATAQPQLKMIESISTAVINFTIATNRKYKNTEGNILQDVEYHKCVAYANNAEILSKYLTKGKKLYVEGKLRTKKRQDSEGHDRFSTEIIIDSFIFLDAKGEQNDPLDLEEEFPF